MERAIAADFSVTLALESRRAATLYPVATLPLLVEFQAATLDGSMGYQGPISDVLPDLLRWADLFIEIILETIPPFTLIMGRSIFAVIPVLLVLYVRGGRLPSTGRDWQNGTELPILVKLPLGASPEIAEVAITNNSDALVIGAPPLGTAVSPTQDKLVTGAQYGPALHGLVLHELQVYAGLDVPLVAVGGVHTLTDARTFLDAGALAVQLDALLFVDPNSAYEIAQAFYNHNQEQSTS